MELQQAIFYSNLFFVLVGFEGEAPYIPELVKVDRLKFVLENLDNLLLEKPNKLEGNVKDLREDLILYVFLFSVSLGRPLDLAFTAGRRSGRECSNLGLRFLLKAFQLELGPCLYGVSLCLGLLEIDLGLQQG